MEFEVTSTNGSNLNTVSPTVIKVVGCGGGGGNAVDCMINVGIQGVDFIAINTDLQALQSSKAECKLQIGQKCCKGQGAGGNPVTGEEAAKENEEAIKNALAGADMVFITCGMGGGTGTGSSPIVARIAKELGALTVAVVTLPFEFEAKSRMKIALEGVKKLRKEVDALIKIPNQQVFKLSEKKSLVDEAFFTINDVLRQGVQGIADIITKTGIINRDFHDVESVMKNQGDAIFGIGIADGENRASDAASKAINNKLLENTHIDGAKHILVSITGNNIAMEECEESIKIISASADPEVEILWGLYRDESLGDSISVTVIATGFLQAPELSDAKTETVSEKKVDPNVVDSSEFLKLTSGQQVAEKTKPIHSENFGNEQAEGIKQALNSDSRLGTDILRKQPYKSYSSKSDSTDYSIPAAWRRKNRGINIGKE